jgi:excisionase family DNA binding protein
MRDKPASAPGLVSGTWVMMIGPDELKTLVADAVREVLRERSANANEPEYLTTAQVAKLLQTSPRNVRYLVTKDGLPALRVGSQGDYRFKRTAVAAYMERK